MRLIAPELQDEKNRVRLLTTAHLDGRTRAMKRTRELVAELKAEIGGDLNPAQISAVERAAALAAVAEDARARRLAGDTSIGLNDLVRVDNAADRALRRVRQTATAKPASTQTLRDYMAAKGSSR
jgi:hypothetical protein